jgi:Fe-S cluster assembly scaffold protein SufB
MPADREKGVPVESESARTRLKLNLTEYVRETRQWSPCPLSKLPSEIHSRSLTVGVRPDEKERSGTYFQIDHSPVFEAIERNLEGKVDISSTRRAVERDSSLKEYFWRLVDSGADEFTDLAERNWDDGYLIRVHEGERVTLPLQACLFISTDGLNQNVHNIIIVEPGAEAQIITGCTIHPSVTRGLHVGISEMFVKKGSKLTFTMIHNWAQGFDARPRTAILVEEDATFVSNYICLNPVRSLQMYPAAYCLGNNSRARFNTILAAKKDSYLDVGAKIVLQGKRSRGEVVSRAIAADDAHAYLPGLIIGKSEDCKGHLECRGLLMSDRASIHAIPRLDAEVKGVELTHEAAVGKIAKDQIEYLMARGFSEEEAQALIIRGFMDIGIFGLPAALTEEIGRMVNTVSKAL